MRLVRCHFRNWCQHRDRTIEFDECLNALLGPNGSGKSNIINGIVFGLTGDFGRNFGLKKDNIYQLAEPEERSGVTLELVHGQAEITLERNLRPNNQKLTIKGKKEVLTRADEINAVLQKTFGVNEKLLLDYVFVDQWKIFAFVDQSPGVRAKAFDELFGVSKADTIWRAIGDLKIDIPAPAIDYDTVKLRIGETEKEMSSLSTRLTKYTHLPARWVQSDDPLNKVIAEYIRKQQLETEIGNLATELKIVDVKISAFEDELSGVEEDLLNLRKKIVPLEKKVMSAQKELSEWTAYERAATITHTLETEIEQLTNTVVTRTVPLKPANYIGPVYWGPEKKLSDYRGEISAIKNMLDTFAEDMELACCPTCFTPIDQLQANIEASEAKYKSLTEKATVLEKDITESRAYDWAIARYKEWLDKTNHDLTNARNRLAMVAVPSKSLTNKNELVQIVKDYEKAKIDITECEKKASGLGTELAHFNGRHLITENRMLNFRRDHSAISITEEQAEAAKAALTKKLEDMQERGRLELNLEILERNLHDDKTLVAKFQENEQKSNKLRLLAKHFDQVRDVFRELPKIASQACLNSVLDEVNDVLDKFDAPFRVLNADNLSFTLKKHSGIITPAERLSGGEKAVFALAFRIVINARFAGQLGLLCLDEPTAGLDEDNIACLKVALGRLRELSSSRGLQVVLITHEAGLDDLFDRVIKLSSVY